MSLTTTTSPEPPYEDDEEMDFNEDCHGAAGVHDLSVAGILHCSSQCLANLKPSSIYHILHM